MRSCSCCRTKPRKNPFSLIYGIYTQGSQAAIESFINPERMSELRNPSPITRPYCLTLASAHDHSRECGSRQTVSCGAQDHPHRTARNQAAARRSFLENPISQPPVPLKDFAAIVGSMGMISDLPNMALRSGRARWDRRARYSGLCSGTLCFLVGRD